MLTHEQAALLGNIVEGVLDNAHDASATGDTTYLRDLYDATEEEILAALNEMNASVTVRHG